MQYTLAEIESMPLVKKTICGAIYQAQSDLRVTTTRTNNKKVLVKLMCFSKTRRSWETIETYTIDL